MSSRPELPVGSAAALLAVAALLLFVPTTYAAEQCGGNALTLEDLKTIAHDHAQVDRVAPYGTDKTLPSSFFTSTEEGWQPGFGLPGLHEYPAVAIEYHGELVIAGWLRTAGAKPVRGIAHWTENGWESLGEGIDPAFALAILNDRLYAGSYGAVEVWDGQSWTSLPQPPLMNVTALLVQDGVLYAGGNYGPAGRVARFVSGAWEVVGGDFDNTVTALATFHGALIVGGNFRNNGDTACGYVARWTGTAWESIGSGIDPTDYAGVSALEVYGDRLIAGGWFMSCAYVPSPGLASWDGTSWSALPGAPAAYVNDLMVMDGDLYIAGSFAGDYASVARWDGTTWTSEGLEQWTLGLASYHGELTAVGGFYGAGCPSGKRITGVATLADDGWNGYERWEPTMHGLALNAGAASLSSAVLYRGQLIVAGIVGLAGNPPEYKAVTSPVEWNGQEWNSLGGGSPCPQALAVVGDDLIGGGFYGISRWDGTAWHTMGSGLTGMMIAIAEYEGKVYVGGELTIGATGEHATLASFDGVEWSRVPGSPSAAEYNTPRVSALEVQGWMLYVGGNFEGSETVHSPNVVAWDGTRWRAVGRGVPSAVGALASYRGELYAGGGGLQHWNGISWTSMGLECQVLALGRYGDKLVIGGNAGIDRFVPGSMGIVSWDGEHWGGFGSGISGQVYSILQKEGDLYVAGAFGSAGDQSSFSVARWGGSEPMPPPTVFPTPPNGHANFAVGSAVVTSSQAQLSFSLPEAGRARLELYDVRGARVATLRDADASAGTNVIQWSSGSPVAFPGNGVYLLKLIANGKTANGKVIFAR